MDSITNESLFDLRNVSQPIVAGDKIFYLETNIDKDENKYISAIFQINPETKERIPYGDSGSTNMQISLSPDKNTIAYLSNNTKDEKVQLFTMPLTGGSATQLTFEKNGVGSYLWLDESNTIYYQASVKQEDDNSDNEKDSKKDLPKKTVSTKLNYKMDGRGVIPEDRLYQVKKITLGATESEVVFEADRGINVQYIAKDESYFLYFDRLDPDDEWVYGGSLYRFDVAKKSSELLVSDMPKGMFSFELTNETEDLFILSGHDFAYKFVTQSEIYRFDLKEKKLTNLTADLDISVGDSLVGDFQQNVGGPDLWWLDNGKTFLFKATEHGKITLYKATIDGNIEKIVDEEMHITGLDLFEDKSLAAITYSTLTVPSALGLLNLETAELTDVYRPNDTFFETHAVSKPERFWFKSVKDWSIQGWYMSPVDAKENHPAILYIHGGPQVSYGETFFHEMQALAAAGYGVILLNPRGGSGYGQEFVASILDNYGDEDYQDLMNGLDYVLENHPEIDSDNLYVAGGSYGGFMTNWIVTHNNRFKAAVTQRSISNWLSFYGASDIGPSFVEFQLGRDLSKADELWQMSPLAHAANAKTPLLVIHGEEDLRCPLEQGQQMYIAMKKQRVETKLVTFPKSSHGLSRNGLPNLRIQRLDEIANWFKAF